VLGILDNNMDFSLRVLYDTVSIKKDLVKVVISNKDWLPTFGDEALEKRILKVVLKESLFNQKEIRYISKFKDTKDSTENSIEDSIEEKRKE
jgi:hypothetical protein